MEWVEFKAFQYSTTIGERYYKASKKGGHTAQRMKFFIQDFFSKCDQIWIWSHLLWKFLTENFIGAKNGLTKVTVQSFPKRDVFN